MGQPKTLENTLVIQARIEGVTPHQILIRDELVTLGLSHEGATDLIKIPRSTKEELLKSLQNLMRRQGWNEAQIVTGCEKVLSAIAEVDSENNNKACLLYTSPSPRD